MIYQTTKDLNSDLKSWGCYFLSILRIFEKEAKIDLKVDDVNMIYKLCRQLGYVGPEAFIIEGAIKDIAQIASAITVNSVYMRMVDSQGKYNNLIAKYSRKLDTGKYNSHFVLMESAKVLEYDSWSARGSRTFREGKPKGYRYIWSERL